MKIYTRYLWYVLRHKWFVMLACFRGGLFWRGITHDLSKLRPSEFFPYARHFYGDISKGRDKTGAYDPTQTNNPEFERAWLHHQRRNDHHWQYWVEAPGYAFTVTHKDRYERCQKVHEMPIAAIEEMVCDWKGAGRAQGKPDTAGWYKVNGPKMMLEDSTRRLVENLLREEYVKPEERR